jgi:hypothetical protein
MENKEKKSKTDGKDMMGLTSCAIHLILIRVNNLERCTHIWDLQIRMFTQLWMGNLEG